MKTILICAMAKNKVIGKNNKLLWHIPEDLKHFKKLTDGHSIIMGRKTYESFPSILSNRQHIVITKDTSIQNEKILTFDTVHKALEYLKEKEKVFIIGGGEIYKYCLEKNLVDEIKLTIIDKEYEGDTFFPVIDTSIWKITEEKKLLTSDNINLNFVTYSK